MARLYLLDGEWPRWYPVVMHREDLCAMSGRVLLASLFLASAFGKITNFESTTRYMEAHGVPLAVFMCALAAGMEALGGISLVLGYQTRRAAASLGAFVLVTAIVFHTGADQRIQLLKNMAILGGLLQIVAFGAGGIALDERQPAAR